MIILRENHEQEYDTMLKKLKEQYGSSLNSHKVLYTTVEALNNLFGMDKSESFYTDFTVYLNDTTGSLLMILTPDEMTGLVLAFEMQKFNNPDTLDGMEAILHAIRTQEHGIVSQEI